MPKGHGAAAAKKVKETQKRITYSEIHIYLSVRLVGQVAMYKAKYEAIYKM